MYFSLAGLRRPRAFKVKSRRKNKYVSPANSRTIYIFSVGDKQLNLNNSRKSQSYTHLSKFQPSIRLTNINICTKFTALLFLNNTIIRPVRVYIHHHHVTC